MTKLVTTLLAAIATILAWIGTGMMSKVDNLTGSFNSYTVVMERRVTLLEEQQKNVNYRLEALQQQRASK
jgi:serine protease inhibitor ecotin